MKSIKFRLVANFMLIIVITVIILEFLTIGIIKQYHYNKVEQNLTNQIIMSSEFYSRYFSHTSLQDNLLNKVDVFWKQTSAQVQIFDLSGNVLMDSIGTMTSGKINSPDFQTALLGQVGKWKGFVDYDQHEVLAVSYPLEADGQIIGILRFSASLKEVNETITRMALIFCFIGLMVVFISGIVSIFLANSIIGPIREVTLAAKQMAKGNYQHKSQKKYDDEIGDLSDTLNTMSEEILYKEQLKNDFIASVSHELRTPLTSIKGWAITLNSCSIEEKDIMSDGLKIIEKESERLTIMVEELLDFSKLLSGQITLHCKDANIDTMIHYIKQSLEPLAHRNKITFSVECEENLPLIYLDENRIKQVLINTLDNAFKFTPQEGCVMLSVFKKGHDIIITITDTGSGISPKDLPYVKDKFYKGKNTKSSSGLGLSISDEIIRLHHGKLDIISTLGKGTTVTIILPLNEEDNHEKK